MEDKSTTPVDEQAPLSAAEVQALYGTVQGNAKAMAESILAMFSKAPATNQMQYYRSLSIEHLEESMHRISDAAAFLMQMTPEVREAAAMSAMQSGKFHVVDGGKK